MSYYLGLDFGTSGARAVVIDQEKKICAQAQFSYQKGAENQAANWRTTLFNLIDQIPGQVKKEIRAIAINGTSSTVLLCDAQGNPVTAPLMYNDARGAKVLADLKTVAPRDHVVLSSTSSLAKLFWWKQQPIYEQGAYLLHQADWLAWLLHGKLGISDYHNALKLGYDVERLCYPDWLENLPIFELLPKVMAPGTPIGEVKAFVELGLSKNCLVCTGTTDSIAAFLASEADSPGEGVTSLGSTLVLKLLSETRVEDSRYGVYSHRLENLWLTGGASNTGGAVLRHFFSDEELVNLSHQIDVEQESPLDYYPLLERGDRFPINDPELPPRLEPRPKDSVKFLHGLLESMARIEARGYQLLVEMGATSLQRVYTAGGGAKNSAWQKLRQRHLSIAVQSSAHTEAAYGTALLAQESVD